MEFRTKIRIDSSKYHITHQDKIVLLGSCFTENIGNYLDANKFNIQLNSHGIIYNPISIFNALEDVIRGKKYNFQDLLLQNEIYVSLNHHGKFSDVDETLVLSKINDSIKRTHDHLIASEYVILSFGSAFVYEYLDNGKVAANCHKIPGVKFRKRRLTIEEIITAFNLVKDSLSDKKIMFTVSPVRHWRDGAVENLRSKSILIESIHQIIEKNSNCFYFPAYEIVMDELRDYRFFEKDMLHPNETAIQYIWERFMETFFSESTIQIIKRIEKINLLKNHRPKNLGTKEYQKYLDIIENEITLFNQDFPLLKDAF